MNNFSSRLNHAMDEKNMSQSELSALTGIGKPSISQYLSGKNEPKREKIKKIAEALQVNEAWLNGMDESMEIGGLNVEQSDKNMSVQLAAELMGKSEEFIRVGLQRSILPFGAAVKLSSRWTYYISPSKFYEYVGMKNT